MAIIFVKQKKVVERNFDTVFNAWNFEGFVIENIEKELEEDELKVNINLNTDPQYREFFKNSFHEVDIEFVLTEEDLISLQKASAVYSLPDLTFHSEEGSDIIKLILRDKENDTSNTYEQSITGSSNGAYTLDLKIENIRVLPGNYSIRVSQHLISEWTNQDVDLSYYIALEPK